MHSADWVVGAETQIVRQVQPCGCSERADETDKGAFSSYLRHCQESELESCSQKGTPGISKSMGSVGKIKTKADKSLEKKEEGQTRRFLISDGAENLLGMLAVGQLTVVQELESNVHCLEDSGMEERSNAFLQLKDLGNGISGFEGEVQSLSKSVEAKADTAAGGREAHKDVHVAQCTTGDGVTYVRKIDNVMEMRSAQPTMVTAPLRETLPSKSVAVDTEDATRITVSRNRRQVSLGNSPLEDVRGVFNVDSLQREIGAKGTQSAIFPLLGSQATDSQGVSTEIETALALMLRKEGKTDGNLDDLWSRGGMDPLHLSDDGGLRGDAEANPNGTSSHLRVGQRYSQDGYLAVSMFEFSEETSVSVVPVGKQISESHETGSEDMFDEVTLGGVARGKTEQVELALAKRQSENLLSFSHEQERREIGSQLEMTSRDEETSSVQFLTGAGDAWLDGSGSLIESVDVENSTESTLLPSASHEIIEQLVERVSIDQQSGADEMHIQLKPDWLGKVKIKVAVENGLVTAHFVAESQTVKALIESGMSQLRDSLENQGLSLAGFSVDVSDNQLFGGAGQFGYDGSDTHSSSGGKVSLTKRTFAEGNRIITEDYLSSRQGGRIMGDGQVDYLV